jgi:putative endonuclease
MSESASWHVYIIECNDKKLYVGIAQDVDERVKLHNKGLGCRFTKYRRPVKLIYKEKYNSKSEARKREIEIKSYTKKRKLELINN